MQQTKLIKFEMRHKVKSLPAVALILVLIRFAYCTAFRRIQGWGLPGRNSGIAERATPFLNSGRPILEVRGGAAKRSRTGSLTKKGSLSSKKKTKRTPSLLSATGKTKVGASSEEESKSGLSKALSKYRSILPLTRIHITLVAGATVVGLLLGEEMTQELLALDPIRMIYGLQLWRPFSAAAFLGPPSIGWLLSGYYLFQYGSTLERAYGTSQHFVFLFSQIIILSMLSILTGLPFFAPSLITAMLHVLSRSMPHQKVKWLIFNVPYWSLPYGLMATDVLQSQSAMAALPHILGILSGHVYYFHKFVWPKMGHPDWMVPFAFIRKRLDPAATEEDSKNQSSISKAIKNRKRTKGRKLGSLSKKK
ncbi:hypothetical protein ACA910_009258 [Epithemia clementina (nom. ined.)]